MNILVTGGLGVNGCWVTRDLLEMGHQPIVLDNRPDFSLVSDIADDISVVVGDIQDFATVTRTLKDYHVQRICHLAAIYPDAADANPLLGFQVNAMATVQLLEAARIMEVERVVFTSSIAALSKVTEDYLFPERKPVNEDYNAYPIEGSVYGATKVASELMGLNYQRLYGIQFVALRFAGIYGPGKHAPRHGNINVVWNRIVEHALQGDQLTFENGGDERHDMTYSRDVARSVILGCFSTSLEHSIFHIGSGGSYTLRDFCERVKAAIPSANIEVGPGRGDGGIGWGGPWLFDISRAKKELGYEAKYDPTAAVQDWLHWLERLELQVVPTT